MNKYKKATKLCPGCIVFMKQDSGCIGYGNVQCIRNVCEPLDEISLYGHNKNYQIYDIKQIVEYPIIEIKKG